MFLPDTQIKFDKIIIQELYGNDLNSAREIYALFIDNNLPLFIEIKLLLQSGNFKKAREVVHKVSPSFTMIGLTSQESLGRLETLCKESSDEALALFEYILENFTIEQPQIKQYLNLE